MKRLFALLLVLLCLVPAGCSRQPENITVEVQPHWPERRHKKYTKIFLAGSIDSGVAADWQRATVQLFADRGHGRYVLYNPRRDAWNPADKQEQEYQINWELEHLEKADLIFMNILGDSRSPISLLEMGLHSASGKLYVACPPEYYRYENVRLTCARYHIPLYNSLTDLLHDLCRLQKISLRE